VKFQTFIENNLVIVDDKIICFL